MRRAYTQRALDADAAPFRVYADGWYLLGQAERATAAVPRPPPSLGHAASSVALVVPLHAPKFQHTRPPHVGAHTLARSGTLSTSARPPFPR